MQVTCGHCQAQYEFDAAAIPQEGYDAQCANCGNVFFVAPQAASPSSEALVSVACQQCGAIYQFAASAIPPGGYDAQCTQCNAVFFVGPNGGSPPAASAPTLEEYQPEIAPADPAMAEVPVSLGAEPEPLELGPAEVADIAQATSMPLVEPTALDDETAESSDLLALSAELGEPALPPNGATPEDDFEAILRRRKRRMRLVLGLVGIVAAYGAITYLFLPVVFDKTLGPLVGIKATINPAAVPHFERGRTAMLRDTDADYGKAVEAFDEALAIDRQYPAALALDGLAHVFRGSDVQARGRAILAEGSAALAKLTALTEAPAAKRTNATTAEEEALRKTTETANVESSKLFEAGGKEVAAGLELLKEALKRYASDAEVTTAAGIYYATDPDGIGKARELLRFSTETRLGVGKKLDATSATDPWSAYLAAVIAATDPHEQDAAQKLLEAALKLEPGFERARYELALLEQKLGHADASRKLAQQILSEVPEHAKAQALLARLAAPTATTATAAPAAPQKPTKAPASPAGRKGKRRGRGGR